LSETVVPFIDLKAQYHSLKPELDAAVIAVMESTQYILGDQVAAFEAAFAAYCGTLHAIAVNSGTSALHLALLAADIGPGDEVITTPYTFVATAAAILYVGATPVLVDIDPNTLCLDPGRLEEAVTRRTKAIIPVHIYGQPCDMTEMRQIAERHDLLLIEDAAQAHGAEYRGRRAGALGDIAAFSFYPSKNLGANGEGGIVTTDREDLALKVRQLRDWGQIERGRFDLRGFNMRMDGIQGAVLGVKLNHLDRWNEQRRQCADRYLQLLANLPLQLQHVAQDRTSVFHVYSIQVADREGLRRHLDGKGIRTGVHYQLPVHLNGGYADLGYGPGDLPNAELAASKVLSLPMYPELTEDLQAIVAEEIRRFLV
jgi:dTDP-4-amino-4,6-dideoxygalactose transaminase